MGQGTSSDNKDDCIKLKVRYKECLESQESNLSRAPWSKVPIELTKGKIKLASLIREIPVNRYLTIVTQSHIERTVKISYILAGAKYLAVIMTNSSEDFTIFTKFLYSTKDSPPYCDLCGAEFQHSSEKYRCVECRGIVCADCFFPQSGDLKNLCKTCLEEKQEKLKSEDGHQSHTPTFQTKEVHSAFTFGNNPGPF